MSPAGEGGYAYSPKRVKYDRQLRLWDDHGQYALEAAHVCLINATATGTEILKSLVLPGVGAFTILDGDKVTGKDAGNNFFFTKDSIGKSRAKVATEQLLELNPDVKGESVEESIEVVLQAEPDFFSNFTIVIATGLTEQILFTLADKLWNQNIPLVVCRAYGMIGYMRLQFSDRAIIESRPETELHDLRLDNPFPSLKQFVDSFNFESLNDMEYSHLPYVVILLKCLDAWKSEHNGEIPRDYKEKKLFKELITKQMRKKDDENFEEAIKGVNRHVTNTTIPQSIIEIFENPQCVNVTSESKSFWILVKALKEFVNNEGGGCLPVRGVIPDMTSDTQSYINLQNIYKQKAEEDALLIYRRVQHILNSIGKSPNYITEQEVRVFCKNAHCLRYLLGHSIKDEYNFSTSKCQSLINTLNFEESDIIFYLLLRAVDQFREKFRRYPGLGEHIEFDILELKNCTVSILKELQLPSTTKDDYIHEMCRFGGIELHSVAAFIGGCAAHEIIKLITGQYVPFNNTLIYNAMSQKTSVFYL